jgi:hypothetical protein
MATANAAPTEEAKAPKKPLPDVVIGGMIGGEFDEKLEGYQVDPWARTVVCAVLLAKMRVSKAKKAALARALVAAAIKTNDNDAKAACVEALETLGQKSALQAVYNGLDPELEPQDGEASYEGAVNSLKTMAMFLDVDLTLKEEDEPDAE